MVNEEHHLQVAVMDLAGRRPLLLFPMAVMIVDLGLLTIAVNLQVGRVSSVFNNAVIGHNDHDENGQ